jgi:exopolysaccharide biosynthesis polyprenyl glycosylphosphotransferase
VSRGNNRSRPLRLRDSELRTLLIVGDLALSGLATFGAIGLWAQLDSLGFSLAFVRQRASWFVFLPLVWLLLMVNLYDVQRAASWRQTVRGVLLGAAVGGVLYLAVYFSSGPGSLPRRGVMYFLILVTLLTLIWRALYIQIFTAPAFLRRALIVGAGDSGTTLLKAIKDQWPPPCYPVGMIDDDPQKHGMQIHGERVLGGSSQLLETIEREQVSDVIVAIQGSMNGRMLQALLDAQERGVEIIRMPVMYEELLGRVPIQHLESDWLLRSFVDALRVSGFYLLSKRLIDLLGGLIGLVTFLILLPGVSLAILLDSGRPIFYRQARSGRGGEVFMLTKFRTMVQDAESDGQPRWAQDDDPRMTAVGRVLRRLYIDELPQFWSVLIGDMSLVGPRPERPPIVAELEDRIPFYRSRLLVKPGITGWAQINFEKGASFEGSIDKLEYDLYYIKHRSLMLDLWLILRTVWSVLGRRGT